MAKKRGGARGLFSRLFGKSPAAVAPAAVAPAAAAPVPAPVAAPVDPMDVGGVFHDEEGGYVEGAWACPSCSMLNIRYNEHSPTLDCENCGYELTPEEFAEVHRQQDEARAQGMRREQRAIEDRERLRARQISEARTQAERNMLLRRFQEEDATEEELKRVLADHEATMAAVLPAAPPARALTREEQIAAALRLYNESGGGRRRRRTAKKRRTKKYRK